MIMGIHHSARPSVGVIADKVVIDALPCRVVVRRAGKLSVGCMDVTVEALELLLKMHREKFGTSPDEVIVQHEFNADSRVEG